MQKTLFSIDRNEQLIPDYETPHTDVGKAVRNANYHLHQEKPHTERGLVLQTLIQHPEGLTDQETADLTGLRRSSVNGRRNELMHEGLVHHVGVATYQDNGRVVVNVMWGCY